MTDRSQQILQRLDEIGRSLAKSGMALALIGVGSVGMELERMDEYSDLDFFVIAKPGFKDRLLQDLSWLQGPAPMSFVFQNTIDGFKALLADNIFCEFAVFEEGDLDRVPFTPGRMVWQAEGVEVDYATPRQKPPTLETHSQDWLLGEALTNIYVGLCRYQRGEVLSAFRFIQGYAVERVVELAERIETAKPARIDPFGRERRYEQRYPETAGRFPEMMQGYQRMIPSAKAILAYLEQHFEVNQAMKKAILNLCGE